MNTSYFLIQNLEFNLNLQINPFKILFCIKISFFWIAANFISLINMLLSY